MMDRRTFINTVAGSILAAPLIARAQQPARPVVGFLRRSAAADSEPLVRAFRQGLSEAELVEGRDLAIDYRWAEGQTERLPALAADLVRRQVAAIVAGGGEALAAAKAATATIPIVFATGDDPVELGFVASFNRPGGNLTGIYFTNTDLVTKRLELLRELIPKRGTIAVFKNPNEPAAESYIRELEAAARALKQQVLVLNIGSERDLGPAFATLAQRRVGALIVGSSALFTGLRKQIAALAASHTIPAIYDTRISVAAGGLMSYGASITDAYREVGIYVGRILKGDKPADLPIMQPTKFELVVNLKTAKALGLTIPQSVLIRADEVIR